jgi:hypothetical protein
MIFVTNSNFLIPKEFATIARGPFIFVRPEFKDDKGLIAHEFVHVSQFWRTFCLHGLFYLFSDSYKLKSEVEAYKAQLAFAPEQLPRLAESLATKYDLGITQERAMELLLEK